MTDPTEHVNASLHEARTAITKLVDLYFDNVPVDELEREQIVETVHEGLSDELDRLYRIDAAVEAVRALHGNDGGVCVTCADEDGQAASYPCPTVRALPTA
ncbi:hypothetical protein [Streptomyces gardneri]|uniref:hypothetical protein n=1 Tax=Streptomyces gardneri TaxID=66892 RepID=UPI0035DE270D